MRIDDLGKINRAQHGCIGQNDILRVAALQNRQRRLQRLELSAVRARVPVAYGGKKRTFSPRCRSQSSQFAKMVHQRLDNYIL